MDEDTQTIARQPSTVIAPATSPAQRLAHRQRRAIRVLALRKAVEATKQRLRGMGLKPQYMPMREIVAIAEEYLAAHRAELVAEVRVIVDDWTAEGFFGKRAAQSVRKDPELRTLPEQEQRECRGNGQ